jgi:hypothetical protein
MKPLLHSVAGAASDRGASARHCFRRSSACAQAFGTEARCREDIVPGIDRHPGPKREALGSEVVLMRCFCFRAALAVQGTRCGDQPQNGDHLKYEPNSQPSQQSHCRPPDAHAVSFLPRVLTMLFRRPARNDDRTAQTNFFLSHLRQGSSQHG